LKRPPDFRDASGQDWYHVPGFGLVAWTIPHLTTQAQHLSELHRPDGHRVHLRLLGGVLPWLAGGGRTCKLCVTRWPCRAYTWAATWLHDADGPDR
jgi:hypothetical protein